MSRIPLFLLVCAVGCGGTGGAPTATSLPPDHTGGPTETPPPASDGAGGGLSPEVVQAVQGVSMLVEVKGLALFQDERIAAADIVAGWAQNAGLSVVPPSKTETILRRALVGQHVVTGKACGAPLFEFQAVQRWRTELEARGKIEVGIYCSPDCAMQVAVSIGTGGEGGTEFFAAPFDPTKPWKTELAARLPTIHDNGGHNQHGHLNNPTQVTGVPRNPAIPDRIADDKAGTLTASETAAAQKCLAVDHIAVATVEYDAAGKLARCEPGTDFLAGATECVCHAITGHAGPANARERIEVLSATAGDRDIVTKDKLVVRATASPAMIPDDTSNRYKPMTTDPAIEEWSPPEREQLSPCFADAVGATKSSGEKIEGRVNLEFDAQGQATKTTIIATTGTITPAQQSCLRDAFLKTRAPCPSGPGAQATAELHVAFDKPE